jgi:hypothetical protein
MNIGQTIRFALGCAVALVVAFFALNQASNAIRERAVDNCARISRYQLQNPTDGTTVWYPIDEIYKKCLNDKGYGDIAAQK